MTYAFNIYVIYRFDISFTYYPNIYIIKSVFYKVMTKGTDVVHRQKQIDGQTRDRQIKNNMNVTFNLSGIKKSRISNN